MSKLVLIRHGESEWNKKALWTGYTDVELTYEGEKEALEDAHLLKNLKPKIAFSSNLLRAEETLDIIEHLLGHKQIKTIHTPCLNERDYGIFTGKNKWEIEKEIGEDEFNKLRRGFDYPIPGGESLKDVYQRVVPFYKDTILPYLQKNEDVLVVAHGNSLRSLIKYLEDVSDNDIAKIEINPGGIILYEINPKNGKMLTKTVLKN